VQWRFVKPRKRLEGEPRTLRYGRIAARSREHVMVRFHSVTSAFVALSIALCAGAAAAAPAGPIDESDLNAHRPTWNDLRPTLPANLEFSEGLRPTLQRMWNGSPTFRRQCARLAETRRVSIVLLVGRLPEHMKSRANAQTYIEGTGPNSAMRAEVWLGLHDLEQNIAHELEHILERLDGVQVEVMNALAINGVTRYGDTFETARARETGRTVAHEVATGKALN